MASTWTTKMSSVVVVTRGFFEATQQLSEALEQWESNSLAPQWEDDTDESETARSELHTMFRVWKQARDNAEINQQPTAPDVLGRAHW
jgi:hypothetical protein